MTPTQENLARAVEAAPARLVGLAAVALRDGETAYASRGVAQAGDDGSDDPTRRADHPAPQHARPVDEDTVFEIGSVTKVFTALLLAVLVEAGEVELDTPLAEIHPGLDLPTRGRPITLVDLATHSAGFPRLPPGLVRQALRHRDDPYATFTAGDVRRALERVRLKAEPGARVRYSNFGAGVLGEALATLGGASYESLLTDRVLDPLGLHDTRVTRTPEQLARRAVGHDPKGRPVRDWAMPSLPGMGALHSTTRDLGRLLAAQLDPDTTPLAAAIRLTQQPRLRMRPGHIGLGWLVFPFGRTGLTLHWHNGGTGGAFSYAGLVAERRTAVAVVANTARPVDKVAIDLLHELVEVSPRR